jgi:hypothetical protein
MDTKLGKVTLTGIDAQTDLEQAHALSSRFDRVEWGILLGGTPTPRYPTIDFIREWAEQCRANGTRTAMHLCGRFARAWIENDEAIVDLARQFGRIQVNVVASRIDIDALVSAVKQGRHHDIITQHNQANELITERLAGVDNHSVLFDASGGRGVGPAQWPASLEGKACGYAGGMGPANVVEELGRIEQAAAGAPFWIDMEGQIRTPEDTLDLTKCEQVLTAVSGWEVSRERAPRFSR